MKFFVILCLALAAVQTSAQIRNYYTQVSGYGPDPASGTVNDQTTGTVMITYDPSTMIITANMTVTSSGLASGNAFTVAHIHNGTFGVAGPVVVALTKGSGIFGNVMWWAGTGTLDAWRAMQLDNGDLYINVHTTNKPAGELRGQIFPATNYWGAYLDGLQAGVATIGYGTGYCTYATSTMLLTCMASYFNVTATVAHVHGPGFMADSPAGVIFALTISASGNTGSVSGSATLTPAQQMYLMQGLFYFNIHSAAASSGEIRGQINMINSDPTKILSQTYTSPCTKSSQGYDISCATVNKGVAVINFATFYDSACTQIKLAATQTNYIAIAAASSAKKGYDNVAVNTLSMVGIVKNATEYMNACMSGFLMSGVSTTFNRVSCPNIFTPTYELLMPDNTAISFKITAGDGSVATGWWTDFTATSTVSASTASCPNYMSMYFTTTSSAGSIAPVSALMFVLAVVLAAL